MKKFFLLSFALLSSIASFAYDFAAENADGVTIYYNYINDGKELEVTSEQFMLLSSYAESVNIPEEVTYDNVTRKVTSIGHWAFEGCSRLTSVTIPSSVTKIGMYAFQKCSSLTSFTIPNSVTSIGMYAFSDCSSLTSVTIPNSVTSIDSRVFNGCSSLTSITIPNSVTSIGYAAFYNCSSLASVVIPNSVMTIGSLAFQYCSSLTSVTIPNSVTSIGMWAFEGCSRLTSIISKIENPYFINEYCFSDDIFNNTTLYVPKGTIDKYKSTDCWNKFKNIVEGDDPNADGIAQVQARPVMITAESGIVSISGAADGEQIIVFSADGEQEGAAIARNGAAEIPTHLQSSSVAIVKIGQKTIKVAMK